MLNPRQLAYRKRLLERVNEKRIIKKTWAESGAADKAIDSLHRKYAAGRPKVEDVPF